MDFLKNLNDSQREAVTCMDGPQLVIAGAGSGKTRVLTYKIAYLLEQGINANAILALTFTNKAAREMKERITKLVAPESARYLWMGTFHAICARLLRQEAAKLGFTRDFSIYDTTDSKSLIKQICKQEHLDDKIYKSTNVLAKISAAKNALMTAEDYARDTHRAKQDRFDRMYEMPHIYTLYEKHLKTANAMDFDDLLMNMCRLLKTDPEALAFYRSMFQYILVDEYQDTNYAQFLLVKMLAEPRNNVCVVGDDAQSIYSFRGADIRNILTFQQTYANARLFKLERNYRSTQTIVNAANSLIHHNEHQIYKNVFSEKEIGEPIDLYAFMTDREEASNVAKMIARTRGVSLDDIAVLYRTNAQSRVLENELRHLNIPYRIYGGTSFYQRKEIKDAIAYFRLAANPKDNEALLRVINFPARGIGDVTVRKLSEQAAADNTSMFEALCAATAPKLATFAQLMNRFIECIDAEDAYTFAERVMRESGIMTAAAMDRTPEGIDRKQNLDELLSGIHEFVIQRMDEGVAFTPIQDFLAEVSLLTDQDQNLQDHTPRVTLMTVHAAKGLEFNTVYIVGLEEDLFPSKFCQAPSEIEEERRLFYVAITRSMQRCVMTFARSRFVNGAVNFASPSRFLKDVDRQYLRFNNAPAQPKPNYAPQPAFSRQPSATSSNHSNPVKPLPTPSNQPPLNANRSPLNNTQYAPGTRVAHKVFGVGTVLATYHDDSTGNDKIDIQFDTQGKKTLLLTFAKLTPA